MSGQAADQAAACRCGRAGCNCAKWERIFKAKFEDPNYYSRRYYGPQSSLAGALANGPKLNDLSSLTEIPSDDPNAFRNTLGRFAGLGRKRKLARAGARA